MKIHVLIVVFATIGVSQATIRAIISGITGGLSDSSSRSSSSSSGGSSNSNSNSNSGSSDLRRRLLTDLVGTNLALVQSTRDQLNRVFGSVGRNGEALDGKGGGLSGGSKVANQAYSSGSAFENMRQPNQQAYQAPQPHVQVHQPSYLFVPSQPYNGGQQQQQQSYNGNQQQNYNGGQQQQQNYNGGQQQQNYNGGQQQQQQQPQFVVHQQPTQQFVVQQQQPQQQQQQQQYRPAPAPYNRAGPQSDDHEDASQDVGGGSDGSSDPEGYGPLLNVAYKKLDLLEAVLRAAPVTHPDSDNLDIDIGNQVYY